MTNINVDILWKIGASFVTENHFGPSFPEVYFTPAALQRSTKLDLTLMTSGINRRN